MPSQWELREPRLAVRLVLRSLCAPPASEIEPDAFGRLTAVADCVVVHTTCADPMGRVARRNRSDRLLNCTAVLRSLGHSSIDDYTAATIERMQSVADRMRTDFDVPVLAVNTDDGFDPPMDRIVAFVAEGGRRDRPPRAGERSALP